MGATRAVPGPATVLRDVGAILYAPAAVMVVCSLCGALYGEWYATAWFLLSAVVTAGMGRTLNHRYEDAADPELVHAMVTAAAGWLAVALLGSLPFLLSAHLTPIAVLKSYVPAGAEYGSSLLNFRDPLHALFESMSGWTTTGLTMSVHEPSLSHAHLLYRSMMQWVGGAGVIVLTLAVLHTPGSISGVSLYRSEARERRLRPGMLGTARLVWKTYLTLTGALFLYLVVATVLVLPDYPIGRVIFDSLNHAMTGQSTGGFSVLDDSIAGYGSLGMDLVHVPVMISGAIAVPVHYYAIFRRQPRRYTSDVQLRTMLGLFAVGVPALSVALGGLPSVSEPFREGGFQYVSALTTTGWQTSSIGEWRPAAILLIVVGAMVIGGATGATVGGVKLKRVILIAKGMWWQVKRTFLPRSAVPSFSIGDKDLSRTQFEREAGLAAVFVLTYLALFAVGVVVLSLTTGPEFTLADSIFESATAQGTVGLSSGITGPGMETLPEAMFILQMWAGRLELIPLLVLARAAFAGFRFP